MRTSSTAIRRFKRISVILGSSVVPAFFLIWAVGMAATTLEPWGDSSAAFYAAVADVLLGIGSLSLALAVVVSRSGGGRSRRPLADRWEAAAYLATLAALAVPVVAAATNSFEASAIGEHGASPIMIVLGGIGLTAGLLLLMLRRIALGLGVAALLGCALLATALLIAPW